MFSPVLEKIRANERIRAILFLKKSTGWQARKTAMRHLTHPFLGCEEPKVTA